MVFVIDGPRLTYAFAATVWCMTSLVAGRDGFKDYKVYSLGLSQTLRCNDSADYTMDIWNDSVPVAWMLPNLTVLSGGDWVHDRFYIGPDNWTLEVANITKEDLGLYHCMLRNGPNYTTWYLARLGLNAEGPYFLDAWKEYEMNTIIGLSAGLGFLAFAVGAMLVYHFRWQPDDESDLSSSSARRSSGHDADDTKEGHPEKSEKHEEMTTDSDGNDIPLDDMPPSDGKGGGLENQSYIPESNGRISNPDLRARGMPEISA